MENGYKIYVSFYGPFGTFFEEIVGPMPKEEAESKVKLLRAKKNEFFMHVDVIESSSTYVRKELTKDHI